MIRTARHPGEIELSDRRGASRVEAALRADGDAVPREVRTRFDAKIREYRDRPLSPDLSTQLGRMDYTRKLVAEIEAERHLEGI
jgi:hypothetical protein